MRKINHWNLLFAFLCFFTMHVLHAQQYPGYTLYSLKNSTSTQLIDTNGTVYHTWTHGAGYPTCYSSYLMPGGILWRSVTKSGTSFTGGPISGEVQKYDYSGTLLWDFVYSTTTYCSHHDICPMPNGNVLLISYESKTSSEVAAAGCSTYSGIMWPDKIVEVQPTGATTGTVVWEWHAWDHLVQNTNASAANYQTSIVNHPELLNINYNAQKDWMHMNGVNYNPMLDQVTFSSHNLNEVFVIDHSTTTAEAASHSGGNAGKGGDILYRWGNPTAYGASGTQVFHTVHDAHWIPEGCPHAGDLSGYNNGGITSPSTASCADIFVPPLSGYNYTGTAGAAYGPATYTKRQASGGYNSNEGSSQELPNGNILINMGISGYIKEYSPTGTLLWSKTLTGSTAKALRYSDCYINNPAPAIPTITEAAGTLSSSAATTYQWYLNGQPIAGETNQSYTPTQSGIYVVRTTDVNGCVYEYSLGYHFTYTSSGIEQLQGLVQLKLFPNPSTGIVNLDDADFSNINYEVKVYNAIGKLLLSQKQKNTIDLSGFENGIYFITIDIPDRGSVNKKIVLQK